MIASLNGTGNVKIGNVTYASAGQNVVILVAAVVAFLLGIRAYRQMDDRKGVSLREDLLAAVRSEPAPVVDTAHVNGAAPPAGLFIAFEGGEGSGKTTQARLTSIWLRSRLRRGDETRAWRGQGLDGAARAPARTRTPHVGAGRDADYAADRAEQVNGIMTPPWSVGRSLLPTGTSTPRSPTRARAGLPDDETARINPWATGGRVRDLTILLDMDPLAGLNRRGRSATGWKPSPPISTCGSGPGSSRWPTPIQPLPGADADRPPEEMNRASRRGSAACSPIRSPRRRGVHWRLPRDQGRVS